MRFHKNRWLALLFCAALAGFGCGEGEDGQDGAQGPAGEAGLDGEKGPDGDSGEDGIDGSDGRDGTDGQDGSDGAAGLNTLAEPEKIGPGETCEFGGIAVSTGIDADGDGVLSEAEISVTEYVCSPDPGESYCPESLFLSGIDGIDQVFYANIESQPLTVVANSDAELNFHLIGDAALLPSQEAGEFAVLPHSVEASLDLTLIAAGACGASVFSFTIEVEDPSASVRFVHLVNEVGSIGFRTADGDSLTSRSFGTSSAMLSIEQGSQAFELIDSDDEVVATSDVIEFDIQGNYTVVAYSNAGEVDFFVLENDPERAIGDDAGADAANTRGILLVEDAAPLNLTLDETAFAQLDFATPLGPFDLPFVGATEVILTESNYVETTFEMPSWYISNNDIIDLFVFEDAYGQLGVLIVNMYTTGASYHLLQLPPPPLILDNIVTQSFDVPGGVWTTKRDYPWSVVDDHFTTGSASLGSGLVAGDSNRSSFLFLDVEIFEPSVLHFDWRASSEASSTGIIYDGLAFCRDNTSCTKGSADDVIGGDLERNNEFGEIWIEYESEVLEPGNHTFTWVYFKDGIVDRGDDMGWVDNVALLPAP